MPTLQYKWKALLTVAMGTMMATMDASITTIAFPELTRVFKTDLASVMWVAVGYILVSSSLMLIFGKISDFMGRSRIYATGMAVFTLGMAACALAQNVEQIIAFRILQAMGAAMSIACGTAIVTEAFPANETGKGPWNAQHVRLRGLHTGSHHRRFSPGMAGLAISLLHEDPRRHLPLSSWPYCLLKKDAGKSQKINLDIMGTLSSSAGLCCLIFGMAHIRNHGFKEPVVFLFVGGGIGATWSSSCAGGTSGRPIRLSILALFKNRTFSYAMAGLLFFFLAVPSYILIMPFYLMQGIHLSPLESGMLMAVVSMVTMVTSPVSGTLSDRFGPVWPSLFGAGATTAAFFCMLGFNLQTGIGTIIVILILLGLGVGAFQPPNNSTIMGSVERIKLGFRISPDCHGTPGGHFSGNGHGRRHFFRPSGHVPERLLRVEGFNETEVLRRSISPAYREVLLISAFLALGAMVFRPAFRPWKGPKKAEKGRFPL